MTSRGFEAVCAQSEAAPIASTALADAECVARVLRGEREAFRPLVETHEAAVFGLCRRLLGGDEAEAEDVSQETFLRAFRRLDELRDRQRFGPWLYQIARSLCRDRVRHRIAERRALERRVEVTRWEAIRDREDGGVGTALTELPPSERLALELKYFEGLSYQEIASRMGLTFARVDHLIRQARARLSRRVRATRQRERSL